MTKFSRLWGQRSVSRGDQHRNLVNSLDAEPLKGFEPELIQILATLGRQTGYVFNVMGQRSRSRRKISASSRIIYVVFMSVYV